MTLTVSIMQPYFFPYIGYFQLIQASDIFVLHDDVQYIKGGWVNRNRILLNDKDRMITLPVQSGPHNRRISSTHYALDGRSTGRIARLVKEAYRRAPHYKHIGPLAEELLSFPDRNVGTFNGNLIRRICEFLGIATRIVRASELVKDDALVGQCRVIAICNGLAATDYINSIGGMTLYQAEVFERAGIALHFLETGDTKYCQYGDMWLPFLSILDVLMFNSVPEVQRLLTRYQLIAPCNVQCTSLGVECTHVGAIH